MLQNKIFTRSLIFYRSLPHFFLMFSSNLQFDKEKKINRVTIIMFRYDSFVACFVLGTVLSASCELSHLIFAVAP